MVAEASGSYAAHGPLEWLYLLPYSVSLALCHMHAIIYKKMHGNADLFKCMHTCVWMCVHSITTTMSVQKVSALSHDLIANNVQNKINDVLCL